MTAAVDPFASLAASPIGPADDAAAVTPSDTENFAVVARGLWVGGAGNVTLVTAAGRTVTFSAVAAGTLLPIRCSRVNAALTSATLIVALI